jgi:Ser/Thr protein kinase RdoA (MazF antagonist)
VDSPSAGQRWALRVHRDGYHTRRAIESELAWMQALRAEAGVHTPRPVPGRDGELIQEIQLNGAVPRRCVLCHWLEGREPDECGDLIGPFEQLGEVSGRMHEHARHWTVPPAFERPTWDFDTSIGERPMWGSWKDGVAITPERLALFTRLRDAIGRRLERFGKAPHRFGLVHADIRLANLLMHDGGMRVIDFDDCGFSWFLYDCATALSFIEHRTDVVDLISAWAKGYRRVRELSAEEQAEILTFVMLRRLLLVAWVGSHPGTDLAQRMGDNYTAGTVDLAERYLRDLG